MRSHLLIVEDDPASVLEQMTDVVPDQRRRTHVADKPDQLVPCRDTYPFD